MFTSSDYLAILSRDQAMQSCTNPWGQVARATRLWQILPSIYKSWVRSLFRDVFLALGFEVTSRFLENLYIPEVTQLLKDVKVTTVKVHPRTNHEGPEVE